MLQPGWSSPILGKTGFPSKSGKKKNKLTPKVSFAAQEEHLASPELGLADPQGWTEFSGS